MKKKFSLLLCMLVAVLAFSGCASKKEDLEYDRETIEQNTDMLINTCAESGSEFFDYFRNMTDFELESNLSGSQFSPEGLLATFDAWEAGVEECGEYVEHGEFKFEASEDELVVSTEATFKDRKATLEFVYNEDLLLETMTVNAHFSIGEILEKAGLNTILGMGTVFAVLIFISIIIYLMKFIPVLMDSFSGKKKEPKEEQPAPAAPAAVPAPAASASNDSELAAVIAAAIAASEGTTTDGFVVRSIKRRKSNKWNS